MFWCLQGRGPGLRDLVPAPRTQSCLRTPGHRTQAGLKDVLETQALWALFQSMALTHFFMCWWRAVLSRSVVSNSFGPHGLYPARLLCPRGLSRQEDNGDPELREVGGFN